MYKFKYQQEHFLEKRKAEATRMLSKFPDRIPVIIENHTNSNIPNIDKNKYLVPNDITIAQFLIVLRKRINLTPEQSIFIFLENNSMPPITSVIKHVYQEYKNKDGFLYCFYMGENSFGKNKNDS